MMYLQDLKFSDNIVNKHLISLFTLKNLFYIILDFLMDISSILQN